jgi:hypothetical protein
MSDFRAVATATEALRRYLNEVATADLGVHVDVRAQKPPTEPPADPTITVFCYQVTPNVALRNRDAPTRGPDGRVLTRPEAALDLHYLISLYGDEQQLVPQRLLGSVARALYEQPILARSLIEDAASAAFLLGSDLPAAPDRIRFTATHLDVDDLYKLWTMMSQTPFALSLTYLASLVVISGQSTPASGPPVATRTVTAVPGTRPVIEKVLARPNPDEPPIEGPVPRGAALVLQGRNLAAAGVWARIAGQDLPVPAGNIGSGQLSLDLPDTLPPGVYPLRILQDVRSGPGTVLTRVLESGPVPFVRQAQVNSVGPVVNHTVTIELDLPVGDQQRAHLLLDELTTTPGVPHGYQLEAPFPLTGRADPHRVPFALTGVVAGRYLLRVEVDGAPTPLGQADDGSYLGPVLVVGGGG